MLGAHALHGLQRQPAGGEAEQRAAAAGIGHGADELAVADHGIGARRRRQRREIEHDGGAVVEEALAGDDVADLLRQVHPRQQLLDHDGVGRSQDRAEDEAPAERHVDAREGERGMDAEGEDHHRQDDADRRQQEDRPRTAAKAADIGAEAGGEEEQRQHAVEEHGGKIGIGEPRLGARREMHARNQRREQDHRERDGERAEEQRDRPRDADEAFVEEADHRREDEEHRSIVEARQHSESPCQHPRLSGSRTFPARLEALRRPADGSKCVTSGNEF